MMICINPFNRKICSSSLCHFSQQKTVTQRIILTFGVSTAQKAAEQREGTLPGAATGIYSRSTLLRVRRAHPAQGEVPAVGQGTVAQSQQPEPAETQILGTENWSEMSRNQNSKNQTKSNQHHYTPLLGIQGTLNPVRTGTGCEQGWSRGAPSACWTLPFWKVGRSSQMSGSVPKTITARDRPMINSVSVQRICSRPLTKPYKYYSVHNIILLFICPQFYLLSVPKSSAPLTEASCAQVSF